MSLIVLVGLPGAGKSTVAIAVASELRWKHFDIDEEIERRAGKPIPDIFSERGEAAFRELEVEVSKDVASMRSVVVAAGGGWMANARARALLQPVARIIYLRVTPATAFKRLGSSASGRPLLFGTDTHGRLESLLRDRQKHYEAADAVLDVEALDPQQVTRELVSILEKLDIIR